MYTYLFQHCTSEGNAYLPQGTEKNNMLKFRNYLYWPGLSIHILLLQKVKRSSGIQAVRRVS